MKNRIYLFILLAIFSINAALSRWVPTVNAQFPDRLVRPCQTGGTSGTVQVTTTNILINPCPGGSVTINGTAITPGPGVTINPTIGTVPYKSAAAAFGDSPITRLSATHMRFFAAVPGGADFDTSTPAITLFGAGGTVKLGDPSDTVNGTQLVLDDAAKNVYLAADDVGSTAGVQLNNSTASLFSPAGSLTFNIAAVTSVLTGGTISLVDGTAVRIGANADQFGYKQTEATKQILLTATGLGSSVSLGDSAGGHNNTIFIVSDPAKQIQGQTTGQVQFGDLGGLGNGTKFILDDGARTITLTALSTILTGELTAPKTIRTGTASNTDLAGQLTVGAGGTITYTFTQSYASAPICTSSDTNAAPNITGASASTTVLTVTGTVGHVVNYICVGRN